MKKGWSIIMKVEISALNQKDKFVYGNKEAIVLEKMNDGVLCMVLEETLKCEFDLENQNDFNKSTLKEKLNQIYLPCWTMEGADVNDFVEMEVDLISAIESDSYGKCKCYLAPITCEQYRKYKKVIPNNESWEWTATAYSTKLKGFTGSVCCISNMGTLGCYLAEYDCSIRPLFKLKKDTEVEVRCKKSVSSEIKALVSLYGIQAVAESAGEELSRFILK